MKPKGVYTKRKGVYTKGVYTTLYFDLETVKGLGIMTATKVHPEDWETYQKRREVAILKRKTRAHIAELINNERSPETRSPFDCLYEPWTMASWAKHAHDAEGAAKPLEPRSGGVHEKFKTLVLGDWAD